MGKKLKENKVKNILLNLGYPNIYVDKPKSELNFRVLLNNLGVKKETIEELVKEHFQ